MLSPAELTAELSTMPNTSIKYTAWALPILAVSAANTLWALLTAAIASVPVVCDVLLAVAAAAGYVAQKGLK